MRQEWKEISDKYSDNDLLNAVEMWGNHNATGYPGKLGSIVMDLDTVTFTASDKEILLFLAQALAERLQKANKTIHNLIDHERE